MELLGTEYSLQRTDVPALLKMVGYDENLAFVEDLVLGGWTPEPPQCLRRFSTEIIDGVDAAGGGGEGGLSGKLRDAILQQELCLRTIGCNRHGHTAELQFPGPMGWTEDYAAARRSNLEQAGRTDPRNSKIISQMERYTGFGAELLRGLDNEPDGAEITVAIPLDGSEEEKKDKKRGKKRKAEGASRGEGAVAVTVDQLKKDVRRTLYAYDDANCLPVVVTEIKRLGVPPRLMEGLLP